MSATGQPVLLAEKLSKRYRRNRAPALSGVDFQLRSGSVTALVGPNGAGKTTLIKCFMGFEAPTTGTVRVGGLDPRADRARALGQIGFVGQDAALYRDLTVGDHLAMAKAYRPRFDIGSAQRRLAELGVPVRARGSELSGGQRAQVALSIALACSAPILILDEPVASLDPLARQNFLAVLGDAVREREMSVLIASHIIADLDAIADRIVILAASRVVLDSPVAAARAQHRVVTGAPGDASVVSVRRRADGTTATLVRVDSGGDASLEEVILGYLGVADGSRRS